MFCCILALIFSALGFKKLRGCLCCKDKRERLIGTVVGLSILAAFGVTLYWHHTKHHAEGTHAEGHQH